MAGFKKVTKEDAEIFLRLYRKYLLLKVDEMKGILQTLPTNVIERCFNSAEFFNKNFDITKLSEATFGVGGLCGYSKVRDIARELEYCKQCDDEDNLDTHLARVGFKVNRKKIGIPGLETFYF